MACAIFHAWDINAQPHNPPLMMILEAGIGIEPIFMDLQSSA